MAGVFSVSGAMRRGGAAVALVFGLSACADLGDFSLFEASAPTDGQPVAAAPHPGDIAGMRYATDRGVEYDITLMPFDGDERELRVHRVDAQPMFAAAGDALTAMRAVYAAYETDICAGMAFEVSSYEYHQPGVWMLEGRCAPTAMQDQEMAAPGEALSDG